MFDSRGRAELLARLLSLDPNRDLGPRREVELTQDVLDVRRDGRLADHQFLRDASIGVPAPDQHGDFALAWAQRVREPFA